MMLFVIHLEPVKTLQCALSLFTLFLIMCTIVEKSQQKCLLLISTPCKALESLTKQPLPCHSHAYYFQTYVVNADYSYNSRYISPELSHGLCGTYSTQLFISSAAISNKETDCCCVVVCIPSHLLVWHRSSCTLLLVSKEE